MNNLNKVVLTGGGTAGHVTPNLALAELLLEQGYSIEYIGSADGIEKKLVGDANIKFHAVSSGKLRRYFSLKNFIDPFKILWGIFQSWRHLSRIKPDIIFSKGGFVAVPVVFAGWLKGIPVIIHESDLTVGLANRLCVPFATRVCVNFKETAKSLKARTEPVVTGTPIRPFLFHGDAQKGLNICGFNDEKPVLLIIGGSLGAESINQCIREALPELLKEWQVIHICGKGKTIDDFNTVKGYRQFEYVYDDLAHFLKAATLIVSRAGANSVFELLALQKTVIFVPLSLKASRGDQIHNANWCLKNNVAKKINDDDLTVEQLLCVIKEAQAAQGELIDNIRKLNIDSASHRILSMIKELD